MWLAVTNFLSKLKFIHVLIAILLLCIITIIFISRLYIKEKHNRIRINNNLESYQEVTKTTINSLGNTVAERNVMYYKTKEINRSQAIEIQDLKEQLQQNNIKLNRTSDLYRTQLEINKNLTSTVYYDTIYTFFDDSTQFQTNVFERDTARIQTLTIIREFNLLSDKADYKVSYNPILYTAVDKYKEGDWKLKNLFVWRDWQYKVNVWSNDSILKPTDIIYIKNIDNE